MKRRLHLLLVDDDWEDAVLFERMVPGNCKVTHAPTSEAALGLVEKDDFDACFVDYRLGHKSGLDLVRNLRKAGVYKPIIMVTGQRMEGIGENALLAGATDFMVKDELDTAAIGRVLRWSLIRQHMTRRMQSDVSGLQIGSLLGSPAKPDSDGDSDLRRVLYISQAAQRLGVQDVLQLATRSAASNARVNITGLLIFAGGCFLQVVEGETRAVDYLMQRLKQDKRHRDVAIVVDEPIRRRSYGEWHMGCHLLESAVGLSDVEWRLIIRQVSRLLAKGSAERDAIEAMVQALPRLLIEARQSAANGVAQSA